MATPTFKALYNFRRDHDNGTEPNDPYDSDDE
jgi:hypothetical protein